MMGREENQHPQTHRFLAYPSGVWCTDLSWNYGAGLFPDVHGGDFLKGYFETGLEWLSGAVLAAMQHVQASDWLISLVVDGIVAGVGGILTFLPNIFILFLALAFLEDSGYMARVAYVMNEIMGRVGLSGKAFLPMLLGFGFVRFLPSWHPCAGNRAGPAPHHFYHTVYVLLCKTSDLCTFFQRCFSKSMPCWQLIPCM